MYEFRVLAWQLSVVVIFNFVDILKLCDRFMTASYLKKNPQTNAKIWIMWFPHSHERDKSYLLASLLAWLKQLNSLA